MTSTVTERHPDLDTWVGYREGVLPTAREETLREHLVACPECLALVRDLAAFEAAERDAVAGGEGAEATGALEVDDATVAAEVDQIVSRALAEETGSGRGRGSRFGRPEPARSWVLPLAASLLAALALGSLLWSFVLTKENRALESRLADLATPHPGAAVVDLHADAVTRSGRPLAGDAYVARETPYAALFLHLPAGAHEDRYRAELTDAGGRRLWAGGGLAPDPAPEFHGVVLGVPGAVLRSTDDPEIVVRLWPEGAAAASAPIAEYRLRIVGGGDPPRR